MSGPWFLTIEGGEGTGKSTQLRLLQQHLEQRQVPLLATREPGGTRLAEAVRLVLLDPAQELDGLSELLLLGAARHDHVVQVVRPALERGQTVLCDRYTDSTLVYQGKVRGLGWQVAGEINDIATGGLAPDLTVVLDMDPKKALARALSRNAGPDGREDRLDNEPDSFHHQVRDGFQELAARFPERVRLIDADADPATVLARIVAILPQELR